MADECARCPDPGMCCRYVLAELARPWSADEIRWLALHPGLSYEEHDSMAFLRVQVACSALDAAGQCTLFGKPERPRMCRDWPYDTGKLPFAWEAPEGCVFLTEVQHPSHPSQRPSQQDSGGVYIPTGQHE